MFRQAMAKTSCALIFIGAALHANAAGYSNTGNDTTDSKVEFGFDVGVDRQHQEFDTNSADLTTVSFAPRVTFGNWEASLDLPWQHAQGGYFINQGVSPSPKYSCANLLEKVQGHPLYLNYLLNNPGTTVGKLYSYCQSQSANATSIDDSVSGLGDATLSLHYSLPLDADGIWLLSVGGSYKFDNGDYDKNLGSGTRNAMLDASLGVSYGWFIGSINAGYAWVSATDATDTKSNYTYGSVDAGIRPLDWLVLGCNWSSDESYYSVGETVQKTTAYVRVKPFDHLGMKIYASDYGSTDYYPDREYGASIFYSY
jgi:hypothetical protein